MSRDKRINWVKNVHYEHTDPSDPSVEDGMKYRKIGDTGHRGPHGLRKTIPDGRLSDGATCAKDLCPEAFFTHDEFCLDPYWDDGTPISNRQASLEYRKILKRNGFKLRSKIRFYATFLFGGGRIKKENGWFFSWKDIDDAK
jgi:hypothetical protein